MMNKRIFGIRVGTVVTAILAVIAALIVWMLAKPADAQIALSLLPLRM